MEVRVSGDIGDDVRILRVDSSKGKAQVRAPPKNSSIVVIPLEELGSIGRNELSLLMKRIR